MLKKSFPVLPESAIEIDAFLEEGYRSLTGKEIGFEDRLLCEEIVAKIISDAGEGTTVKVSLSCVLKRMKVKFVCQGLPIDLQSDVVDDFSACILRDFEDRVKFTYLYGVNYITITRETTSNQYFMMCVAAMLSAVLTGLLFNATLDFGQLQWLDQSILYPVSQVFIRLIQTIAVPVAFFALIVFFISLNLRIENGNIMRLALRFFFTSLIAIGIGVGVWFVFKTFVFNDAMLMTQYRVDTNPFMGDSLPEFLMSAVPGNFIEPFTLSNPLPMLITAVFLGIGSATYFGPGGNAVRGAMFAVKGLVSKLMSIIYGMLPFFLYFSCLENMLFTMGDYFRSFLMLMGFILGGLAVMLVYYMGYLSVNGIDPFRFIKENRDLIRENFKIGSNIDALPYNKRTIRRKQKLPNVFIWESLELGALMNMNGNCIIITFMIMTVATLCGINMNISESISLFMIIILLSIGAPNQPASFLLCMIVLSRYIGISSQVFSYYIIFEGFLCKAYSFVNSMGDITIITAFGKKNHLGKYAEENGE